MINYLISSFLACFSANFDGFDFGKLIFAKKLDKLLLFN
jgi:hypothetical protein